MVKNRDLIDKNGEVILGRIKDNKINFNYKSYKLLNFFNKEINGIRKRINFHHFNYYALLSEKYILAFAVVDLGFIKNMFIYLYDYNRDFLVKRDIKISPLSKKLQFPIEPDQYEISFIDKKSNIFIRKIFNQSIYAKIVTKELNVEFLVKYNFEKNQPLKIVVPAGHNGWSFTEKISNLDQFEKLFVRYKNRRLDFNNAILIYDWSGGYLKRETSWIWANFAGYNYEKKLIGANFAAMVNETYKTENIYWIGHKFYDEEIIKFKYDRVDNYKSWTLTNKNKTINIIFKPKNEISDETNIFFVKNSFKQFVGKFSGYLIDETQKKVLFENISGVTEIHRAIW